MSETSVPAKTPSKKGYVLAVERLFRMQEELEAIDLRLVELASLIRTVQPRKAGSITLHLYDCGHGCMTCPHLCWYQWYSDPKRVDSEGVPLWLCTRIKAPLPHLKRKGAFEAAYETSRELMVEALHLESRRAALTSRLSRL